MGTHQPASSTREQRREAKEEHASSGAPGSDSAGALDHDIGPYGAGCRAFTANLRRVNWPTKFRPDLPDKYDGTIDPEEFLQIYTTAI